MYRGASSSNRFLMERLEYLLLRLLLGLLARLPWWVIHCLCRLSAFLLEHALHYRRRVIRENLANSFPEKSEAERRKIERDFYLQFAYNFLSTPKLLRLPSHEIMERHFLIPDLTPLRQVFEEHPCAFAALGHLGNWELFSTGQLYFDQLGVTMDQVYRPLKSKLMDEFFARQRQAFGATLTPKAQVARRLVEHLNATEGKTLIAMITDQAPGMGHVHYFTLFLNQATAVLDGVERLARKYNLPVLYFDIERVSPVRFVGRFRLITYRPRDLPPLAITEQYTRLLEETIRRDPASWLWSHRRWKRPLSDYPEATLSEALRGQE